MNTDHEYGPANKIKLRHGLKVWESTVWLQGMAMDRELMQGEIVQRLFLYLGLEDGA